MWQACWDIFVAWLLADDEHRVLRLVILGLGATLGWRAIYLYAQRPPAPRTRSTPDTMPAARLPRRHWITSRPEKLATKVREAELETELLLKKTSSVRATAELEQARFQLNALLRELKAQSQPQPPATAQVRALTLTEIEQCLQLIDVADDQHRQLVSLIAARIEEKLS